MSTNQVTYVTGAGSNPQFVAETDVNSDGRLDIIVANSVTGIGVFLNNGSGVFTAQTIYPNSNWSMSVAAVDVNNDGKPDIIVANNLASNVGVLLNTGSGTFTNQTIYPTGSNSKPFCLVAIDINSDGKPDIVVSNNYDNNIGVFLNTGNGTFANQTIYPTDSSPKSIAAADVNGDGKPDIIVANYNASNIGVLLNTGLGTFTNQTTYSTGAGSYTCSVAIADFNGDSKPDIIVANYVTNNIGVFLNTGTGTFFAQTTYSTGSGSGPFSVAAADINSDGRTDIIVANYNTNNVGVFLNTGVGTFSNQTTYSTGPGSGPAYVAAADINGDSKLDLIVTNYAAGNIGVFLSSCA